MSMRLSINVSLASLSLLALPACGDPANTTETEVSATVGDSENSGASTTDATDATNATNATNADATANGTSSETTSTSMTDSTTDATTDATSSATDSSTTGSTTDATTTGSTTDGELFAPWILSIDEPGGGVHVLLKISVEEGEVGKTTVICDDLEIAGGLPADSNFTSLTFNNEELYASSNGNTLAFVNPCECKVTPIGPFGFENVNGITSNEAQNMFGASVASDVIVGIDPMTGASQVLSQLPGNWGPTGLTWSDPVDNLLYGINATDDRLYTFDGDNATSLGSVPMTANFASVGLEFHPGEETLYACGVTNQGTSLFSVDLDSGEVTLEAADVLSGNCDNLAAPFGPVECIPQ